MLKAKTTFGKFWTTLGGSASFENDPANVSVLHYPLAGFLLGGFLLAVNRLAGPSLHSEILAAIMVGTIILATGGRPMNGAFETLNELAASSFFADAARRPQVYGTLAVLLIVLFKIKSIEVLGENRGLSLLLSPLMARWSLVLFLYDSTTVGDDFDRRIAENVRSWHLIVATAATLGFSVYYAGPQTLWVALGISLIALFARGYLQRREGGVSPANCGALIELNEALSFTLLASL